MKKIISTMLCFTVFAACSSTPQGKSQLAGLSLKSAAKRSAIVSDVQYDLSLKIDGSSVDVAGENLVRFNLAKNTEPLRVDFTGGKIKAVTVNGAELAKPVYDGLILMLPAKALKVGKNEVIISYAHPYSRTGTGFYRFQDPEDGRFYLFSDFEPYQANQLFPCFDQPDLKARFTLTVEAPEKWTVISTTREDVTRGSRPGFKQWHFPETARISTYVFSVHAGEFKVWEDRAEDVPLRLFARHSLARYVDATEWFKFTKQGFSFYEKEFDFAYPFEKYDQILVPDFNWGGMENVAAVTYSDKRLVFRSSPAPHEREKMASVILHELAHMWFGDLVTMAWWDDLWLNESFATYMASRALHQATDVSAAWLNFFAKSKAEAYASDQLVTTHPVSFDVPDTESAFANFDAITYGKGASSMKQIAYLIGEDKFRDGLRAYFKKHAFKNARLADFMNELSLAAERDLSGWSQDWIATAGLNTLQARYECEGKKISSFDLVQSAGTAPALRQHRTEVVLFGRSISDKSKRTVAVDYSGEKTAVASLIGTPCPKAVYPNYGDHDYVKVKLDDVALAFVRSDLASVKDAMLRLMLWHGTWESVRDGEFSPLEFGDLILKHLPAETDYRVAREVSHYVYGQYSYSPSLLGYFVSDDPKIQPIYAQYAKKFETFFDESLKGSRDLDFQKLWFDGLVRVAHTPEVLDGIVKLLENRDGAYSPDQDRRWMALARLSAAGHARADELITKEANDDPSHSGKLLALAARAAKPDLTEKKIWLSEVADSNSHYTSAELKAAFEAWLPLQQFGLRSKLSDGFFDSLNKAAPSRDAKLMEAYVRHSAPMACTQESISGFTQYLTMHAELPPIVIKNLKEVRQEDERCFKIRHALANVLPSRAVPDK